jgi:hypothetical protein
MKNILGYFMIASPMAVMINNNLHVESAQQRRVTSILFTMSVLSSIIYIF